MRKKALSAIRSVFVSKGAFIAVFTFFVCCAAANAGTFTPTGAAVTAEEMDSVWNKVGTGISGTYGKLTALGVIIASVWKREQLGNLAMGVGILVGVLIPNIPSMVDKFSYCI